MNKHKNKLNYYSEIKKELKKQKEDLFYLRREYFKILFLSLKNEFDKNLKKSFVIIKNICPYVVAFTITSSLGEGFGFGKPFVIDDVPKYKYTNIDFINMGFKKLEVSFIDSNLVDKTDNYIIAYSPWKLENGKYMRIKRTYSMSNIEIKNMFYSVMNGNVNSAFNSDIAYNDEIIYCNNNLPEQEFVHINLAFLDLDEKIMVPENDGRNINVTVSELLISIFFGYLLSRMFKLNCINELNNIDSRYISISPSVLDDEISDCKKGLIRLKKELNNCKIR